ncbi:hypothetical protein FDUTEX481_09372 [Tolypothrix sp. PCC 7601]|nr:hypothetical protein FDUTEX481_09372 [Tolypothrix sp. PCC 7601]BAY91215.1 hypothetical protein NIES3275_32380 [Microchaete diplosiphon NIES-3275]
MYKNKSITESRVDSYAIEYLLDNRRNRQDTIVVNLRFQPICQREVLPEIKYKTINFYHGFILSFRAILMTKLSDY